MISCFIWFCFIINPHPPHPSAIRKAEAGGSVYVGYFEANQKHGDGTCTGANGSVYTGQWDCDKMHGRGKFTAGDGT